VVIWMSSGMGSETVAGVGRTPSVQDISLDHHMNVIEGAMPAGGDVLC
jgi:hypothetical protein